ncbi:PWWP domain [Cinara cedri]|uniref:PWWP domain n=1 Tax=Cinara cedri TaxID=506608 RepID=A0A5E4NA94_9HEMI|nr:PWWP domain [Cinara cedri]
MSDQRMLYEPGTLVWMKVFNRVWWPGKVVDPMTAPKELQYSPNSKKSIIAMVHFERDDVYDVVINSDKVALYSCSKKMEFLEKGYSLYLKQKRSSNNKNAYMTHFVEDVLQFEKEINGDINIFKNFEENEGEHATPSIEPLNDHCDSSKQIKKKDTIKKSQEMLNKPGTSAVPKKSVMQFPVPVPYSQLSSIRFPKVKRVIKRKPKASSKKKSGPIYQVRKLPASPPSCYGQYFTCHLKKECKFTTNRYVVLKRHLALCKTTVEDETKNEFNTQTSIKRKSTTNQKDPKKLKVSDELLENCDGRKYRDYNSSNDPEPGSTVFTENKKENEIQKSDENATENMNAFENSGTIENIDIQKEHFNHDASNKNDTKKLKIQDKLLEDSDYEEHEDNNSSNNDTEPGSTIYLENNEENLNIVCDENATENMDNFENTETFQEDCGPGLSKVNSMKSGPSTVPINPVRKLAVLEKPKSCFGDYFTCQLKAECNFRTKRYEILKRHMAVCKTAVGYETQNEYNTQTSNKKKNSTNQSPTKQVIMFDELLEEWNDDNCKKNRHNFHKKQGSTIFTENKKKKLIVIDLDDEIKKNDENAIKNLDILENSETIENVDIQREDFNHGNSSGDPNIIEKLMEELVSIVEQDLNSDWGIADSETNDN